MKRFLFSVGLLLVSGLFARAEIVMSPGTYNSSINTNAITQGVGFTFTTTSSAAPGGRWQVSQMQFGLGTTASNISLTQAAVKLFKLNTTNNLYEAVAGGSQSSSYTTLLTNTGANNPVTFNFTPSSVFGIAGDLNSGLEANATYLLGLTATVDANASSVWWGGSSTASSGTWGTAVTYTPTGAGATKWQNSSYDASTGVLDWSSGTNFRVQLDATAVPEPGTLILGSIAAIAGGGGVFWRRRRKKATEETTGAVSTFPVSAE